MSSNKGLRIIGLALITLGFITAEVNLWFYKDLRGGLISIVGMLVGSVIYVASSKD